MTTAGTDALGRLVAAQPRRLARLARRAHRARRRGQEEVSTLAERARMTHRQLLLLADAWAAGGRSGVAALAPSAEPPDYATMREAGEVVERWRQRHYPLEALRWDASGNCLTVWQLLAGDDPRSPADAHPVLQLRNTDDGQWHLFRHSPHGEWWPVLVAGRPRRQRLEDCLETVRSDAANQFWAQDPHHR